MNPTIIRNLNIVKTVLSIGLVAFLIISVHSVTPTPDVFAQGIPTFSGSGVQTGGLQPSGGGTTTIPTSTVQAQTGGLVAPNYGDLHGFAWSDMPNGSDQNLATTNHQAGRGLGWISMNGSDTGVSGNYAVSLSVTGNLTGNAWSEYGGWLDFTPAGPYPTLYLTSSTASRNVLPTTPAMVDRSCMNAQRSNCAVTGWARFIAGEDTDTQNTGGWDGWVNFSGHSYAANSSNAVTSTFGVTYDANPSSSTFGKFNGYAWGGAVAGWINFNGVSITPPAPLPPNSCTNVNATNYGQPLPCVLPPGYCIDPLAVNYGLQGTCTYQCPGIGTYATNPVTEYPYPAGGPVPTQCGNIQLCTTAGSLNVGGPLPCIPSGTPPNPRSTASVRISSSGCSNGSTTLTWSSSGTSVCTASYSGSGVFTGNVATNNSSGLQISSIPQDGSINNFTITCTAQSGYTPASVTSSTSVMCPVVCTDPNGCGGGPGTTGTPKPIYKEN